MDSQTQLAATLSEDVDNGDFLLATKYLTDNIQSQPTNHELYFERSICHHKLGNFQASLDDADSAIRLNPSDYNIHYQKGLALVGLSMFAEAVTSFKKAIELRAKQEDSKLSDIFRLLRDAINEIRNARGQTNNPGAQQGGVPGGSGSAINSSSARDSCLSHLPVTKLSMSAEPVDSTTDRPQNKPGSLTSPNDIFSQDSRVNMDNNLVANCNTQSMYGSPSTNQMVLNIGSISSKVSSSANHCNNNNILGDNQMSSSMNATHPINIGIDAASQNHHHDQNMSDEQSRMSQFEWNIRRSERIFLHGTSEPGTSSPQLNGDPNIRNTGTKHRTGSNPSSISSGKGPNKRIHESNIMTYQSSGRTNKNGKSKDDTTNSHLDSDIDVTDTHSDQQSSVVTDRQDNMSDGSRNRVMIAPSSSMPATSQSIMSGTASAKSKYSSKYKRLRRDRERARRGTSKVCTIKPEDLEDLRQSPNNERFMRVIAPIDGWLYSGQLSADNDPSGCRDGPPQYVVKLDGDTSGRSYLFVQDTVLNDIIKEVKVDSVPDLRKGARICCYWSRTYKCLSTGVVTSRTFEATKTLVSVKYDNGDLSALPVEDLRLLPPDYPKYMSSCDPLLLARNGDGVTVSAEPVQNGLTRISTENNEPQFQGDTATEMPCVSVTDNKPSHPDSVPTDGIVTHSTVERPKNIEPIRVSFQPIDDQDETDDEEVIPPTNEAIDFITSETLGADLLGDDNQTEVDEETRDDMILPNEPQSLTGRITSEASANNFGVEYRPWMFDGKPKSKSKRNGRTYRENYTAIRRGNEVLKIGDSCELMPTDESILPFIGKIVGLWRTSRGEMQVLVRWYYRLRETQGEPSTLKDGENALFETDHIDENDVQSIWRSTRILSWTDYSKDYLGHLNKQNEGSKVFYLAGYYDPVNEIKHLRTDVKEAQ